MQIRCARLVIYIACRCIILLAIINFSVIASMLFLVNKVVFKNCLKQTKIHREWKIGLWKKLPPFRLKRTFTTAGIQIRAECPRAHPWSTDRERNTDIGAHP